MYLNQFCVCLAKGKLIAADRHLNRIAQRRDLTDQNADALGDAHIHNTALDGSLAVQLAGTALTFGSAYGVVLWAGHASNIAQLALAIPAGAAVYAASLLIGDRNWFRLLKKR